MQVGKEFFQLADFQKKDYFFWLNIMLSSVMSEHIRTESDTILFILVAVDNSWFLRNV